MAQRNRQKRKTAELEPDLQEEESYNDSHEAAIQRLLRQIVRNQKLMLVELKRLK